MFNKASSLTLTIASVFTAASAFAGSHAPYLKDCNVYLTRSSLENRLLNDQLKLQGFALVDDSNDANFIVDVYSMDHVVSFADLSLKPREWDHGLANLRSARYDQPNGPASNRKLHQVEKILLGSLATELPTCDAEFLQKMNFEANSFGETYFGPMPRD